MDLLYNNLRRLLWYILAGMKGGPTRIRIMKLILDRPFNMNQLKNELNLDYKTIQHHIKILEDNKIIVSNEKKYGTIYFPTQLFEKYKEIFYEIVEKVKVD